MEKLADYESLGVARDRFSGYEHGSLLTRETLELPKSGFRMTRADLFG